MARTRPELDTLVPALKRRDPVAFRQLYEDLADSLGRFAFGILRDRSMAEDVVQQAFLEFVQAAPTLKGSGRSVRAWLYRSVRFRCLDELRRRSRRPEDLTNELPELESTDTDPMEEMLDPVIEVALDSLTPEQRTVVLLRHVEGLSGSEVAKVVGSNRVAVYAMTSRAEASLRRALQAVESDDAATSEHVRGAEVTGKTDQ